MTGDHQWIHTDPERATQTPFGGTIAHGYYTLSLHPRFAAQIFAFEGFAFAVNYGLNKVRFPAPLPVGNRVRMRAALVDVEDVLGGAQITMKLTFEGEGALKPVCVAEQLTRVYTGVVASLARARRARLSARARSAPRPRRRRTRYSPGPQPRAVAPTAPTGASKAPPSAC